MPYAIDRTITGPLGNIIVSYGPRKVDRVLTNQVTVAEPHEATFWSVYTHDMDGQAARRLT